MRYGWSLIRSDWSQLPSELVRGRRWRSVQFNMADVTSVPATAGVYIICASPPGQRRSVRPSSNDLFRLLYTAIYAGKSENLRRRFKEHCETPRIEIVRSRACFAGGLDFWFTRLDANQLDTIESQLIECLGPPANAVRGVISARIQNPVPA